MIYERHCKFMWSKKLNRLHRNIIFTLNTGQLLSQTQNYRLYMKLLDFLSFLRTEKQLGVCLSVWLWQQRNLDRSSAPHSRVQSGKSHPAEQPWSRSPSEASDADHDRLCHSAARSHGRPVRRSQRRVLAAAVPSRRTGAPSRWAPLALMESFTRLHTNGGLLSGTMFFLVCVTSSHSLGNVESLLVNNYINL